MMTMREAAERAWNRKLLKMRKDLFDAGLAARMIDCMDRRLRYSPDDESDFDVSDRVLSDIAWQGKLVATAEGQDLLFVFDHEVAGDCSDEALWATGDCPKCGRRVALAPFSAPVEG